MKRELKLIGISALSALAVWGCTGSTDGGEAAEQSFSDTQFVAGPDTVGTLDVSLASSVLSVGSTSSFTVTAKDVNGSGVGGLAIACDTEKGLALIEPSSGQELTGSSGVMSGIIGCLFPGSFNASCRGPVGVNLRKMFAVKCEGEVPLGFGGFPGAGGGGLGGGVQVPGDADTIGGNPGGVDSGDVRVVELQIFDVDNTTSTTAVDVHAIGDCNGDGTADDPEPFVINLFTARIQNNSNTTIAFTAYRFSVPEASGSGTATYTSPRISFNRVELPANGSTGAVTSSFTEAADDLSGKTFRGNGSRIPGGSLADTPLGSRNVAFTFYGVNAEGESITVRASAGISFNRLDNCNS